MSECAEPVRDAAELLVREHGRDAAEAELEQRAAERHGEDADRALAALAALRKGEVGE